MYLIGHSRSCRPQGTVNCGIRASFARRLVSSCSAPNGQSQPQKTPRPQKSRDAATENHSMNISGSIRNADQEKSVITAEKNASTLTTESCAFAYHPRPNSVKVRKPMRNQNATLSFRVS